MQYTTTSSWLHLIYVQKRVTSWLQHPLRSIWAVTKTRPSWLVSTGGCCGLYNLNTCYRDPYWTNSSLGMRLQETHTECNKAETCSGLEQWNLWCEMIGGHSWDISHKDIPEILKMLWLKTNGFQLSKGGWTNDDYPWAPTSPTNLM